MQERLPHRISILQFFKEGKKKELEKHYLCENADEKTCM